VSCQVKNVVVSRVFILKQLIVQNRVLFELFLLEKMLQNRQISRLRQNKINERLVVLILAENENLEYVVELVRVLRADQAVFYAGRKRQRFIVDVLDGYIV
jgi:hypothetical protein